MNDDRWLRYSLWALYTAMVVAMVLDAPRYVTIAIVITMVAAIAIWTIVSARHEADEIINRVKQRTKNSMEDNKIDHTQTDAITCPHCGYRQRDSWELPDSGELECDCGGTFTYERDVTVTYSTFKLDKQ